MPKPTIYLESSIVSYMTARETRDVVSAARQYSTRQWWDKNQERYHCFISEIVLEEISKGDPIAARLRLEFVRGLPVLNTDERVLTLARVLLAHHVFPKSSPDVFHLAIASVHEMDYLLSWNFRHLVNVNVWRKAETIMTQAGYHLTLICSPEVLE